MRVFTIVGVMWVGSVGAAVGCMPESNGLHEPASAVLPEPAVPEVDFREASFRLGIRTDESTRQPRSAYGPFWADLDDDGWLDLVFMNHGKRPELWRNDRATEFVNLFDRTGLRYGDPEYFAQWDRHGTSCADIDNDGDLDLFVTHGAGKGRTFGVKRDELLVLDDVRFQYEDVARAAGVSNSEGRARFPTWVDVDRDGLVDLYIGNAKTPNVMYRNLGDGTFADRSVESGLDLVDANRHAWSDVDRDGDPDVVVVAPLELYRNDGSGVFEPVERRASGLKGGGIALAVGDVNGDGRPDLFVTAAAGNRLFLGGTHRFEVARGSLGPSEGEVCKGVVHGDIDNDGSSEFVVGCTDGIWVITVGDEGALKRRLRTDAGLDLDRDVDVALGDFDGDGALDLAVNSLAGNHLFRNETSKSTWLALRFDGAESNRIGLGTRIEVRANDQSTITREYFGDTGLFGSAGCGPAVVGTGEATTVGVDLSWPSGRRQRFETLPTRRAFRFAEGRD